MSQTIHRNTIEFEVCGDYALFSDVLTRPSGEKCTYDIPTYEAIKGIVHSITLSRPFCGRWMRFAL